MTRDLTYLLDRAEISDVVLRYFYALDRFDWDALAGVLADEVTLGAAAAGVEPEAIPRDAFIASVRERNGGFVNTIHFNPGHLIEIDGDSAHVVAHMFASHIVGAADDELFWGYGFYHIDLGRAGASWVIKSCGIEVTRGGGADPAKIYGIAAQRQRDGLGH